MFQSLSRLRCFLHIYLLSTVIDHTFSQCMEGPKIPNMNANTSITLPATRNTEVVLACADGYQLLGSSLLTCVTEDEHEFIWLGKLAPICVERNWIITNSNNMTVPFNPELQIIQLMLHEHKIPECDIVGFNVYFGDLVHDVAWVEIKYNYANKTLADSFLKYRFARTNCPTCYDFSLPINRIVDVITLDMTNTENIAFYDGIAGKEKCFHERLQLDKIMTSGAVREAYFQHYSNCRSSETEGLSVAYRILPRKSPELLCTQPPHVANMMKINLSHPLEMGIPVKIMCQSGYELVGYSLAYCKGSGDQYNFPKNKPLCKYKDDDKDDCQIDSDDRRCQQPEKRYAKNVKRADVLKSLGGNVISDSVKDVKISPNWVLVIVLGVANFLVGILLTFLLRKKLRLISEPRSMSERVRLLDRNEDEDSSDQEIIYSNDNEPSKKTTKKGNREGALPPGPPSPPGVPAIEKAGSSYSPTVSGIKLGNTPKTSNELLLEALKGSSYGGSSSPDKKRMPTPAVMGDGSNKKRIPSPVSDGAPPAPPFEKSKIKWPWSSRSPPPLSPPSPRKKTTKKGNKKGVPPPGPPAPPAPLAPPAPPPPGTPGIKKADYSNSPKTPPNPPPASGIKLGNSTKAQPPPLKPPPPPTPPTPPPKPSKPMTSSTLDLLHENIA